MEYVLIDSPFFSLQSDSDHLICLSLETILDSHSILIFCPTKAWCEKLSETVAKEFFNLGNPANNFGNCPRRADVRAKLQKQLVGTELSEVLEQLKRSPAGLDPQLGRAVQFGVAYHHAGQSVVDCLFQFSFLFEALNFILA